MYKLYQMTDNKYYARITSYIYSVWIPYFEPRLYKMLGFNMALIFYFAIVCETFMKLKRPSAFAARLQRKPQPE